MSFLAVAICFISCHGGPSDHFATFAEALINDGYEVQICAGSEIAKKKFQDKNLSLEMSFSSKDLSKEEETDLINTLVKKCSKASVVLTDVGHPFDIAIQKALKEKAPQVLRCAYYDNPEPYVPGGYSTVAAKVMHNAQKVIFANGHLAEQPIFEKPDMQIDLEGKTLVGLGYYPLQHAQKIVERRKQEHQTKRAQFLESHGLSDKGQKVVVYFGGNNEEYFTKAFPAFSYFLSESMNDSSFSNVVVVLQQHPEVKNSNLDVLELKKWIPNASNVIVSNLSSDEMQVIADGVLYYQTSMGPLFALVGIPRIQVGHATYEDILVRNRLCQSVTNSRDFLRAITSLKSEETTKEEYEIILKNLGIRQDWFLSLKQALSL